VAIKIKQLHKKKNNDANNETPVKSFITVFTLLTQYHHGQ